MVETKFAPCVSGTGTVITMTRIAFLVVNLLFLKILLESVRGALHITAQVATTESGTAEVLMCCMRASGHCD